jgi:hypothetical protein
MTSTISKKRRSLNSAVATSQAVNVPITILLAATETTNTKVVHV